MGQKQNQSEQWKLHVQSRASEEDETSQHKEDAWDSEWHVPSILSKMEFSPKNVMRYEGNEFLFNHNLLEFPVQYHNLALNEMPIQNHLSWEMNKLPGQASSQGKNILSLFSARDSKQICRM